MKLPRFLTIALAAGLVIPFSLTAIATAQTTDPAQIIRERREGLRAVGAHLEAMQAIAAGRADPTPAVARIDAVIAFFQGFPDRFPPNTQAGETRALPAVFTDRAGFITAYNGMTAPLANLRAVAAAGDSAAFPAALQQLGASCGNCHRGYRGR